MNDWLNEFSQRDNFTLVRYEALRASPAEHFRDLLAVLGESQPDGTIFQDALEFSRFENMQKLEAGSFRFKHSASGEWMESLGDESGGLGRLIQKSCTRVMCAIQSRSKCVAGR